MDPRRWLVAFDFDGTLSEIVPRPADAVLDPVLLPALEQLRALVGHLAVISGRDLAALSTRVPSDWLALGSYGLELPPSISATGYPDGFDPASALKALRAAGNELEALIQAWPGARLEAKTWGRALHFRGGAEAAFADPATTGAIASVAARDGLEVSRGRLVVEVRPAGADKGSAMTLLIGRLAPSAISFTGDDLGDVPAWEELRRLASTLPAVAVAIDSPELDPGARVACDVVLPSRAALLDFVERLHGDRQKLTDPRSWGAALRRRSVSGLIGCAGGRGWPGRGCPAAGSRSSGRCRSGGWRCGSSKPARCAAAGPWSGPGRGRRRSGRCRRG